MPQDTMENTTLVHLENEGHRVILPIDFRTCGRNLVNGYVACQASVQFIDRFKVLHTTSNRMLRINNPDSERPVRIMAAELGVPHSARNLDKILFEFLKCATRKMHENQSTPLSDESLKVFKSFSPRNIRVVVLEMHDNNAISRKPIGPQDIEVFSHINLDSAMAFQGRLQNRRGFPPLRPYPKMPAARNVIQAQAKWRNAR